MARRDAAAIESECEALVSFAEALLTQLQKYRSADEAYYVKKAKTLREYKAPTPSVRLRGLKMGVRDLLEMTDDLPPKAVSEIDASLATRGILTLSAARKEL